VSCLLSSFYLMLLSTCILLCANKHGWMDGCRATGRQSCQIFGFWPIFPIQTPKTYLRVSSLHHRLIPISPCDSRRSNGVPSGTGGFLRLLVGELGPRNLPKFSPMANGYIHTECNCTARQIWTKDLKTRNSKDRCIFPPNISPLPPKSPQNPILGDLSMQNLLYR